MTAATTTPKGSTAAINSSAPTARAVRWCAYDSHFTAVSPTSRRIRPTAAPGRQQGLRHSSGCLTRSRFARELGPRPRRDPPPANFIRRSVPLGQTRSSTRTSPGLLGPRPSTARYGNGRWSSSAPDTVSSGGEQPRLTGRAAGRHRPIAASRGQPGSAILRDANQ